MRKPRADEVRIATEAARWQQLLSQGSATERERAEFTDWVKASPRHLREFMFAEALDAATAQVDPGREFDLTLEMPAADDNVILLQGDPPVRQMPRRRRHAWLASAVAASALVALAIVWWARPELLGGWQRYETRVGEQRAVQLEDGSILQLNTDSRIRVRYSGSARDIRMLHGEAFFKVANDVQRPFRVQAGDTLIRALGTQFDVYHREATTKVAVVEGRVEISRAGTVRAGDGAAAPRQRISRTELGRGEAARIAAGSDLVTQAGVDIASATAWQQRRLVFNEESLGHIADEFNRYNATPRLIIEDEAVRARRLGGTFDADDPGALVSFVLRNGDLEAERTGERWIIRPRSNRN